MRKILLGAAFVGLASAARAQSVAFGPSATASSPQHAYATTTATNGQFSVTFARAFLTTTPVVRADPLGGGVAPQVTICQIDSIGTPTTSPVIAGHCSTSAPAQALGNSGETSWASGGTVMVTGADRTQ